MSGSIRTVISVASLSLAGYYYHKYSDLSVRYEKLQQKHKLEFENLKNYFIEKLETEENEPKIEKLDKKEIKSEFKIDVKVEKDLTYSEKAKNLLFDENFRIKRRFI